MKPRILGDYKYKLGEGPLWHPVEKLLYLVDKPKGQVHRINPKTSDHEICYEGEPVTGITANNDGYLILFMQNGGIAKWKDGKVRYIINQPPELNGQEFNDVIADPIGRVFTGSVCPDRTKGERTSNLYCIDVDGSINLVANDIGFANGLAFSPECKQLYLSDTTMHQVYKYDYDIKNGRLTNRRIFVKIDPGEGYPDGITVDSDGFIWVAQFGGGIVVRYTPQGFEERRIHFPAKHITSITFGSADLTEIYVTSAKDGPRGEDNSKDAGSLFNLQLDIRGVPEYFSRIIL